MLLYYGIVLPEKYDNINWSKDMIQWVYKQRWSYAPATEAMKSRLEEYLFLRKQYLHVGNELRSYARKHFKKDYYLLRTVPGIGPLTAIGLLAEVGDIRRFKNIDYLSSYIRLVPFSAQQWGKILQSGHYLQKQGPSEKLSGGRSLGGS